MRDNVGALCGAEGDFAAGDPPPATTRAAIALHNGVGAEAAASIDELVAAAVREALVPVGADAFCFNAGSRRRLPNPWGDAERKRPIVRGALGRGDELLAHRGAVVWGA